MTIISAKHISQINMLVWLQEIFTVCVSFISRGEHKREVHSQIYCWRKIANMKYAEIISGSSSRNLKATKFRVSYSSWKETSWLCMIVVYTRLVLMEVERRTGTCTMLQTRQNNSTRDDRDKSRISPFLHMFQLVLLQPVVNVRRFPFADVHRWFARCCYHWSLRCLGNRFRSRFIPISLVFAVHCRLCMQSPPANIETHI